MSAATLLADFNPDNGKFERDFADAVKIGKGGFSSVYAARHKVDQQLYAIKKTVLKVPTNCTASVKEEMRRMLQEVRLFAAISNPHIIRYNHSWIEVAECPTDPVLESVTEPTEETFAEPSVELESPFIEFAASPSEDPKKASDNSPRRDSHDCGSEGRTNKLIKISLFIQMELCAETLEDYLSRRSGPLTLEEYHERLNIAGQIVDAIYAIHCDYKIIHRDLSLRNIFIGKDGAIKIGDFGLATKCRHLIPVLASPFVLKPMEPLLEESPDSFVLSGGLSEADEIPEDPAEAADSDSDKLTNGVGTKTFAAPEQMSNLPYDQKADIYSLGLILLVLFNPTQTISERYEILRKCRQEGPSKEFLAKYPEIGAMIKKMTSTNPTVRPSATELKESHLFKVEEKVLGAEWEKLGLNGKKCIVKVGTAGKCKTKYVKIFGGNLLLYAKKIDKKAKLCYPLSECKILMSEARPAQKTPIRRNRSSQNFVEDVVSMGHSCKVSVEHPQLETLHFFVQNASLCTVT